MLPVARKDIDRLRHAMQLAAAAHRARAAAARGPQPAASAGVRRRADVARGLWRCAGRRRAMEARETSARASAASRAARRRRTRGRGTRGRQPGREQTPKAAAQETRPRWPFDGLRAGTRRLGRLYLMIQVAPMRTARPGASVTSGVRPTSTRLSNAFSRTNSQRMCARRAADLQIDLRGVREQELISVVVELRRHAVPQDGRHDAVRQQPIDRHRARRLRHLRQPVAFERRLERITEPRVGERARDAQPQLRAPAALPHRARDRARARRRRCGARA